MSPEKILKTKPHGYGPHDLRRCQSVENRLVNERSSGRAHVHMVQCSLARHGDEIEHEWRGRKFGQPSKATQRSSQPWRCAETEIRDISPVRSFIDLTRVRCSLSIHGDEIEHVHRGRKFGTPRVHNRGSRGRPIRCAATEQRNVERNASAPARWVEIQCSLKPHGDEIEHEWRGRKFGTPMRRGNDRPYKRRPRKVPWRIRRIHDNRWRAEQGLPPIEQTSVGRA